MTYKQDYCPPGDYFICSDTSVAESEEKSAQEVIPSQELPLDTSLYQSAGEPHSKSAGDELQVSTNPIETSHYKKSSVRKITYRVTKK